MPYEHQPYPSVRYHRSGETCIVRSDEEHEALGEDWAHTPAAFEDAEPSDELEDDREPAADAPKHAKAPRAKKAKAE